MEKTYGTKSVIHVTERKPPIHSRSCHDLPLLVLLHGWLGSKEDFVQLSERLACEGYHVIIPDLPYHGNSSTVQPASLADAAKLVIEAILDILGPRPKKPTTISLLGYSLGGRLAVEAVIQIIRDHSTALRLGSLQLISCAPPPLTWEECREREQHGKRVAQMLQDVAPSEDYIKLWLCNSWYTAPMWGDLNQTTGFDNMVKRRSKGFNEDRKNSWMNAAVAMARYEPIPQDLFLDVPMLYIYGELDKKYRQFANQWGVMFQDFRSVPFRWAGHNVFMHCPEEVENAIIKFLEENCSLRCQQEESQITSVKMMRYSLPLLKPIVVGGRTVVNREGVLLALISTSNEFGIGDVCPLPGLHSESLDECIFNLKRFIDKLKLFEHKLCMHCSILDQLSLLTEGLASIVCNAISCAVTHILSQANGMGMTFYLRKQGVCRLSQRSSNDSAPDEWVRMNGVLARMKLGPNEDHFAAVQNQIREDRNRYTYQVLKLKVGSGTDIVSEALNVASTVRAMKSYDYRIRLDANRLWEADQFITFQETLGREVEYIDFIEEPLRDVAELTRYVHSSKEGLMGVALDESLAGCPLQDIWKFSSARLCKAFVIKPCVIGGVSSVLNLACCAEQTGNSVVFSSTFDSGVGLAWTAVLAASLAPPEEYHGVATFSYLRKDVCDPSFEDMCVTRRAVRTGDVEEPVIIVRQCEEYLNRMALAVFRDGEELLVGS